MVLGQIIARSFTGLCAAFWSKDNPSKSQRSSRSLTPMDLFSELSVGQRKVPFSKRL